MTHEDVYDAFNDNLHLMDIIDGSEDGENIRTENKSGICDDKSGSIAFSKTTDGIGLTTFDDLKLWDEISAFCEMEKPSETRNIRENAENSSRIDRNGFENYAEDFPPDTTANLANLIENILDDGSLVQQNYQSMKIQMRMPPASLQDMRTLQVHHNYHSNLSQEYNHEHRIGQRSWTNGCVHLPPSLRMPPEMRNVLLSEINALNIAKQKEFQAISSAFCSIQTREMNGNSNQEQKRLATAIFQNRFCVFCKTNGEPSMIYNSHVLRNNGKVVCPLLKMHSCEICGAHGEKAHTRTYCPHYNEAVHGMLFTAKNSRHCKPGYISPHETESCPRFHQDLNQNYFNFQFGQQKSMENHLNSYEQQSLIKDSSHGWSANNCGYHLPQSNGNEGFIDPSHINSHQNHFQSHSLRYSHHSFDLDSQASIMFNQMSIAQH